MHGDHVRVKDEAPTCFSRRTTRSPWSYARWGRLPCLSRALSRWLSGWDDLLVDRAGGGCSVGAVAPSYKGHRYPVEVISHCVWLYHRFPLSFPRGRGADARARDRPLLRDSAPLVRQVRATVRRFAAPPAGPDLVTSGTWTRSSSRSTGNRSICGGRSTRTATSWTSWHRAAGTRPRPNASRAG